MQNSPSPCRPRGDFIVQPVERRVRLICEATSKAALLLFSVAVLLAGGAGAVRGQSALDVSTRMQTT